MEVYLRLITLNDSSNIVKWRNSSDVKQNLFTQDDITIDQQKLYFSKFIETKKIYQFIIVADGVECGTTFLKNIDLKNKCAEFGIFIGEPFFRGKGIGTISTKKTIEFGFNTLNLKSIYLTVFSNNIRAIKSYENVGFSIIRTGIKNTLSTGKEIDITKMKIELISFWRHA